MDEYEGMKDMSPETDDDEAEDRCPVPDSDSESDVELTAPQNRGAELTAPRIEVLKSQMEQEEL